MISVDDAHEHPYPLRGCNSDLAQYSNTPSLHLFITPRGRIRGRRRSAWRAVPKQPSTDTGLNKWLVRLIKTILNDWYDIFELSVILGINRSVRPEIVLGGRFHLLP